MNLTPYQKSQARQMFDTFIRDVPGVRNTLLISADGLLVHSAGPMDVATAETLAALTANFLAAGRAAGERIGEGRPEQIMARYPGGVLLFLAVTEMAGLLIDAGGTARIDVIVAFAARLVESTGEVLAPRRRDPATQPVEQALR